MHSPFLFFSLHAYFGRTKMIAVSIFCSNSWQESKYIDFPKGQTTMTNRFIFYLACFVEIHLKAWFFIVCYVFEHNSK